MAFRFSGDGPAFPNELLDQMLAGEVVFLCGAGVSLPQLPGFNDLVTDVFADIGLQMDEGEKDAFDHGRYEEALGSLARRVVHPNKMYDAVERLLAVPVEPDLSRHLTLLRLSRNLDNQICIVTTNFDTLFERAVAEIEDKARAASVSIAGQALPAPGAEDFSGVVHLHGRLPDTTIELGRTPLVLTSAEYGDAYMRAGWASRFLFDLARCKSIVLIGYRVGDAPVRYFLNVLEADRERFTDLRTVYTLEGVDELGGDADARWSIVAVQPITYPREAPDLSPHGVLWRDLEHLAEMLDRPKLRRREFAHEILSKPLDHATADDLARLDWLMRGKGDLWDIVIAQVEDPAWFKYFGQRELWQKTDPDWLIPQWFTMRWTSRHALEAAIDWCNSDRLDLVLRADQVLHLRARPAAPWYKPWNLLATGNLHRLNLRRGDRYLFSMRMQIDEPTDLDLRRAVDLLTPTLAFRPLSSYLIDERETENPQKLRDFFAIDLTAREGGATELLGRLRSRPQHAPRLLQLSNEALRSTIHLARDAEMITEEWDSVERGLPSIADNAQNAYHDGVIYLVDLATHCYAEIAPNDPRSARQAAEAWKALPSTLGARMWLHALTRSDVFAIAEVVEAILALPHQMFWERRPELFALVTARLAEASAEQIEQIAERVADEGPNLFQEFEPPTGGTDWRPYSRDHAIWSRLASIDAVNPLPEPFKALMHGLTEKTPYLDRELEEQDFFGVYSSGVQMVTGDPEPFLEAEPEARLELAHGFRESRDIGRNSNWLAYCRSDPSSAFRALTQNGFQAADADLWNDLINSLTFPVPDDKEKLWKRRSLLQQVFKALYAANDVDLHPLIHALSTAIQIQDLLSARAYSKWWDRLWNIAVVTDGTDDRPDQRDQFYDRVINTAPGKLAETLLRSIEKERKGKGRVGRASLDRLKRMATEPNFAGELARGVLARSIGFVIYIDQGLVLRHLLPFLKGTSQEAVRLRHVMAEWAQLGAAATKLLKGVLLEAASEIVSDNGFTSQHAVAKILNPILGPLANRSTADWGFTPSEVREALRSGSIALRVSASQVLLAWQRENTKLGPEETWRQIVEPAFISIWPQERRHKDPQITTNLAYLCIQTGNAFPAALETVKPYLSSEGDRVTVPFLFGSDAPINFPEATLDLLWCVLRKRADGYGSTELGEALDKIKAAEPRLEIDRRFQWLETRAMRLV